MESSTHKLEIKKSKSKQQSVKSQMPSNEDKIRELAYLKWQSATGGQSLPEDPEGIQFWIEAERELNSTSDSE